MDCKNVLYLIKQNFILEKINISESIKINVLFLGGLSLHLNHLIA